MIRLLLRSRRCVPPALASFQQRGATYSTAAPAPVSKEAMLKLRKKTGYSFVNCRKALLKFGEQNITEAEKWLRELALKEGWAKAAKVGSRITSQGLCAVLAADNLAAVVELNCETDFVAKSADFKQLVEGLTLALLEKAKKMARDVGAGTGEDDQQLKTVGVDLGQLLLVGGVPAQEAIAKAIGKLGENITITKAQVAIAKPGVNLHGHSHPKDGTDRVSMGRFVSLISLERTANTSGFPSEKLAYQLCQHVIGMNPTSLGEPASAQEEKDAKEKRATELSAKKAEAEDGDEKDELNSFTDVQSTHLDEDESQLLRQAFMLEPSQSVQQYLDKHGAVVSHFLRFEHGKGEVANE